MTFVRFFGKKPFQSHSFNPFNTNLFSSGSELTAKLLRIKIDREIVESGNKIATSHLNPLAKQALLNDHRYLHSKLLTCKNYAELLKLKEEFDTLLAPAKTNTSQSKMTLPK